MCRAARRWSWAARRHLVGVVAGDAYIMRLARSSTPPGVQLSIADQEGRSLYGGVPPARSGAVRVATSTGLPWTLSVTGTPDDVPGHRLVRDCS